MKRLLYIPLAALIAFASSVRVQAARAPTPARERLLMDFGWKFHLGNDWGIGINLAKSGTGYGPASTVYSDASWRTVNLPHDWAIELPFDDRYVTYVWFDALLSYVSALQAAGVQMVAYTGLRTAAQQHRLWEQGRKRPGAIVTHCDGYKVRSKHQDGLAVDCAFWARRGDDSWVLEWHGPWEDYGRLGEAEGLIWGGRWTRPVDRPHLEWRP